MTRGKSQYLTNAGKTEATPVWLIQILGVEERANPAITHNYYFTDAGEAVSFFNELDEPEAYLPIGMEVSPVDIDTSQKMVSFSLRFDNVSRQMALLAGTVRLSSGRCVLMRAFMEDLSDPAFAQTVFRGSIRSWTIGEQALELEIGSDIPLINKAPRRLFSVRCQWKFKDANCAYSGAATTCDKSLAACKALSNQAHFGGFPHIPQSRDPRVAWTKN